MLAQVSYAVSGDTYAVPFNYLHRTHLHVYVDGVEQDFGTDWTLPTPSSVEFASTPSGSTVKIRRITPTSITFVDFSDSSRATEAQLDRAKNQALYLIEEAQDGLSTALVLDSTNTYWDALEKQIKDLAAPTANADAATKLYVDTLIAAVEDLIQEIQIEAGNVPTPSDPTDNGKVLTAQDGAYDWQDPTGGTVEDLGLAAHINTLLNSASAAAARAAINAAQDVHVHAAADITSGTIATARLGSGTANTVTFLRGDQSWQEVTSGIQPAFFCSPRSAAFPGANFPELKKFAGTNWITYSLGFDKDTDEAAHWEFKIPTTAQFTTATIKIVSRQLSLTTGNAAWQVTTLTYADGEAFDAGTPVVDAVAAAAVKGTAGQLLFQSAALTVTGWAPGETLLVKINRDVSADDVAEDVEFVGAVIELS